MKTILLLIIAIILFCMWAHIAPAIILHGVIWLGLGIGAIIIAVLAVYIIFYLFGG